MSGRRLDLTQRQVRALCEGAKKAGYAPVLKVGNTVVLLLPEDRAVQEVEKREIDQVEDFRL